MSNILIISYSNHDSDPRVSRQIRALAPIHKIVTAGTAPSSVPEVDFVKIGWSPTSFFWKIYSNALLLLRQFHAFYWVRPQMRAAYNHLKDQSFDLVIANDIDTLPLALKLANGRPVFLDAHEYAPLENEESFEFRLFVKPFRTYVCRKLMPKVSKMTTVCKSIAKEYKKNFGVDADVVTNAPDYHDILPRLRNSGPIRIVHHGIGSSPRRLEWTIDAMNDLDDRFELTFLLLGDPKYIETLKARAKRNKRIHFLKPVPMRELPVFLNQFDVGIFLLPEINFNYRYALPNKFFEFVQARLAIAIGPSPEMARYLEKFDLGIIAADYEPATMAKALSELNWEKINTFKRNAHLHARDLSAEPNIRKMKFFVEDLLKS